MENQLSALERKIDELLASVDEENQEIGSTPAEATDTKTSNEQERKK